MKSKKYIIYNKETGEEYTWGYNQFTAINNLNTFRCKYGDRVAIRWE